MNAMTGMPPATAERSAIGLAILATVVQLLSIAALFGGHLPAIV